MCSFGLTARIAPLVLLAGLALAGCSGGDDGGSPQAAPSASTTSETPTTEPSPTPSGPDRSPEALAELSEFTAPAFADPVVQEAVEGYQEFVRQLVVAQGLADGDYPPLLATIEPGLVEEVLGNTRVNVEHGGYLLGPRVDSVVDGTASGSQVLLAVCSDVSNRTVYYVENDEVARPAAPSVHQASATMIRAADGWVLSGYVINEQSTACS